MVFHDESGSIIEYGNRWGFDSPPDDTYSRVSNLERYAPLHVVADALVAFLRQEYQAEVVETASTEGERTVELVPANPDCAPVKLRYTDFPAIEVSAGRISRMLPSCGCDACDETWEESVDDLEKFVLGVAQDGFVEAVGLYAPKTWQPWPRRDDG